MGVVMNGVIVAVGIIFIGWIFLSLYRGAAKTSRKIGLPHDGRTAALLGGTWWPGKLNAGSRTVKLEFFDQGIRLRGSGSLAGLGVGRLLTPVWEARYAELTEARLVTAPKHQGVRLAAGSAGPLIFWTRRGSEVLDRLEEHNVPVDRDADDVPDPPPIRMPNSGGSWAN
jgi:hypothetical protein